MSLYSLESCCIWFYHLCQFLYRNYHSITKRSTAISCHSLFPTWECKQTWLLLNFVPTIDFTSSQFPAYEKRQWTVSEDCVKTPSMLIVNVFSWDTFSPFCFGILNSRDYHGDYLNVMFSRFPNYFLLFPLGKCWFLWFPSVFLPFPHSASSVSYFRLCAIGLLVVLLTNKAIGFKSLQVMQPYKHTTCFPR